LGVLTRVSGSRIPRGEILSLERLSDDDPELLLIERFGDVVEGPRLQSFDGVINRSMSGDHDHRKCRVDSECLAQEAHSIEHRHAQIADQKVNVTFLEYRKRLASIPNEVNFVPIARQLSAEHPPQVGF